MPGLSSPMPSNYRDGMDVDRRGALLRRVDGIPPVVLGPLLLAGLRPLERSTGASRRTLAAILVPFTVYGVAVVMGTREPDAPVAPWLMPLAVTANTAAVVAGSAAMTQRGLTPLGRLAGAGLAAGGARLLLALRRPLT